MEQQNKTERKGLHGWTLVWLIVAIPYLLVLGFKMYEYGLIK